MACYKRNDKLIRSTGLDLTTRLFGVAGLNSSPIAMRSPATSQLSHSMGSNSSSSSIGNWLTPPSPSGRYLNSASPASPSKHQTLAKHGRIHRIKSTKVNFLSSSEDLIQTVENSPVERQVAAIDSQQLSITS